MKRLGLLAALFILAPACAITNVTMGAKPRAPAKNPPSTSSFRPDPGTIDFIGGVVATSGPFVSCTGALIEEAQKIGGEYLDITMNQPGMLSSSCAGSAYAFRR